MNTRFDAIVSIDWLINPESQSVRMGPEAPEITHTVFPISPEIGEASLVRLDLTLGMTVYRTTYNFKPAAFGKLYPMASVSIDFPEPVFMVQIMRGGRGYNRDLDTSQELVFTPGNDLYRYADRLRIVPVIDGSHSSEMTGMAMGRSLLDQLIGDETAGRLLNHLGLTKLPSVLVRSTPVQVSNNLARATLSGKVATGRMLALSCQARVLDYLDALIGFTQTPEIRANTKEAQERSQAVRETLSNMDGKLPSLDALARDFGTTARILNQEFVATFGKSIYVFVNEQRLSEAHQAILESAVALKILAARLGYSHVNHFITAFRRNFGYTPGFLRRNKSSTLVGTCSPIHTDCLNSQGTNPENTDEST